ncbi:MAG: ABC transporter ATP-binding protein, partial [Planctomyces sp.]
MRSSRQRFENHRDKVRRKELPKGGIHSSGEARSAKDRVRSGKELVFQFFRLMKPYRTQILWILLSVTIATIVGLLPPAGTKFILDYGLSGQKLPESVLQSFPSLASSRRLLLVTVIAVAVISLFKIALHLAGRWYATRIS